VNLAAITQAVPPFAYVDAVHGLYCIVSVSAPWRENSGPYLAATSGYAPEPA
jgi:hypothetical protein